MRPNELYKQIYKKRQIENRFAAVIPSCLLPKFEDIRMVIRHFSIIENHCDRNIYIVMTNMDAVAQTGHYIVLMRKKACYEIFDPAGNLYCSKDKFVAGFIKENECVINRASCQAKQDKRCGWYCLFYIALRTQGLRRARALNLLLKFDKICKQKKKAQCRVS